MNSDGPIFSDNKNSDWPRPLQTENSGNNYLDSARTTPRNFSGKKNSFLGLH